LTRYVPRSGPSAVTSQNVDGVGGDSTSVRNGGRSVPGNYEVITLNAGRDRRDTRS
jgi:hypothetical protein